MPYFHPVSPGAPLKKKIRQSRTDDFLWEEQSQNEDDEPYDYTGHEFKLEIKEEADGDPVVEMSDDSFEIDQSDEGGDAGVFDKFRIEHPPDDFADLIAEPFCYYADIQITDAQGRKFTPIVIDFFIIAD